MRDPRGIVSRAGSPTGEGTVATNPDRYAERSTQPQRRLVPGRAPAGLAPRVARIANGRRRSSQSWYYRRRSWPSGEPGCRSSRPGTAASTGRWIAPADGRTASVRSGTVVTAGGKLGM